MAVGNIHLGAGSSCVSTPGVPLFRDESRSAEDATALAPLRERDDVHIQRLPHAARWAEWHCPGGRAAGAALRGEQFGDHDAVAGGHRRRASARDVGREHTRNSTGSRLPRLGTRLPASQTCSARPSRPQGNLPLFPGRPTRALQAARSAVARRRTNEVKSPPEHDIGGALAASQELDGNTLMQKIEIRAEPTLRYLR